MAVVSVAPPGPAAPSTRYRRLLLTVVVLVATVAGIQVCRQHLRASLYWLERQSPPVVSAVVCLLYVIVSLPIGVGYVVLVAAGGYLYGPCYGMALSVVGATFGLSVAHLVLRMVAARWGWLRKYAEGDSARAIMRVVAGPASFKIVFCSRLTPIPFGLQNTFFALSSIDTRTYHTATMLGLLVPQFIAVYIGSTLRSMNEVIESQRIGGGTYFFIASQLVIGVALMVWFSARARKELAKAIAEAENSKLTNGSVV